MCKNIEKNMSQINDQRTTFALEQVNQDLKVCLPLMELAEQKNVFPYGEAVQQEKVLKDKAQFSVRQLPSFFSAGNVPFLLKILPLAKVLRHLYP